MATNIQSFSGNIEVASNLTVDTNTFHVDSVANMVGLGTTNPSGKLHISNAGAVYTAISDTSAGTDAKNWWTSVSGNQMTHYLSNDANSASQPYMKINRSGYGVSSVTFDHGNVGVGTAAPLNKFHVTTSVVSDGIVVENNGSGTASWMRVLPHLSAGSYNGLSGLGDAGLFFSTDNTTSNEAGTGLVIGPWSENAHGIKILENGNVGIGTAIPSFPLDVIGSGKFGGVSIGTSDTSAYLNMGYGTVLFVKEDRGSTYARNWAIRTNNTNEGDFQIGHSGTNTGGFPNFYTTPADAKLTINRDGYVGIGLASPLEKLHVEGNVRINPGANARLYIGNNNSNGNPAIILGQGGTFTEDTMPTIKKVTDTNNLAIMCGGNVGIGTASPASKFTIRTSYAGGESSGLCLDSGDGTVYNFRLYSFVQSGGNVGWNFRVNNAASSVDALTLGSTGNVGIGTTSPSFKLAIGGGGGIGADKITSYYHVTGVLTGDQTYSLAYNQWKRAGDPASDHTQGIHPGYYLVSVERNDGNQFERAFGWFFVYGFTQSAISIAEAGTIATTGSISFSSSGGNLNIVNVGEPAYPGGYPDSYTIEAVAVSGRLFTTNSFIG